MTYSIQLSAAEVQLVLAALAELPLKVSAPTYNVILDQRRAADEQAASRIEHAP